MKKIKKGFTLVELLVVIAIIAILAAIIAPNAFKAIEKSKVATAESDYRAIKTAVLNYYADTGKWSTSLSALNTNPTVDGWNGPYLEKLPVKNPWGGTYSLGGDGKTLIFNNVPEKAATRIDEELDDGVANNGDVIVEDATSPATDKKVTITIAK